MNKEKHTDIHDIYDKLSNTLRDISVQEQDDRLKITKEKKISRLENIITEVLRDINEEIERRNSK